MSDTLKTVSKNGYEIRTEILGLAQGFVTNEYSSKFESWRLTADRVSGSLIAPAPTHPTAEDVLATAEKFYSFVNKAK